MPTNTAPDRPEAAASTAPATFTARTGAVWTSPADRAHARDIARTAAAQKGASA